MTSLALFAVLAAAPAPTPSSTPPPEIARLLVLELSASGVEPAVAKSLTEVLTHRLREALPSTAVLGQSEIDSMLALEKQRDVLGCASDVACLAEIGGALGADHLVVGSVGRVGKLFLLTVKLLRSADATTVRHVSAEVAAREELLLEAARQWGTALIDPSARAGRGYLEIGGEGEVEVDGVLVGKPPLRHAVEPGEHRVAWRGARPAERMARVDAYDLVRVSPLDAPPARSGDAWLEVTSAPDGLVVLVDGQPRGRTPAVIDRVAPGIEHVVEVDGPEVWPSRERVTLAPGESRRLAMSPERWTTARHAVVRAGLSYWMPGMYTKGFKVDFNDGSRNLDIFAVDRGAGVDVTATVMLGRAHALVASASYAQVDLVSDEPGVDAEPSLSGTTLVGLVGYQYVAPPLWSYVRPYASMLAGVISLEVATTNYAETLGWRVGDDSQLSFALVPELGVRAELPIHLSVDLSMRLGAIMPLIAGEGIAYMPVTLGVGTAF